MSKKDLAIIIVTYNSSEIIKNCLTNLNTTKYDVIVVDNGSTDDSHEIVTISFPQIKTIKLEKNIGYGRANNVALRQVKTNFALLLNADAIIDEQNIDHIIGLMKQNQKIAIAGAMVYSCQIENNQIINQSLATKINHNNYQYYEDENFYFSQFITGAGMFLNMPLMQKIGFFDEGFFLYCEDNELCKRVVKKGYQTAIVKGSKFYHLSGKSCKLTNQEITRIYWHRFGWSKLYYVEKIWGPVISRAKAIIMIFKFSALCLKSQLQKGKIDIRHKCGLKGCIDYFIGLKAFKKDNTPRG